MKEKYIELMETVLSAYADEHIQRYFDDVKQNGLTEHGFPRLTSDIGILIAHGRRKDLMPIFLEMMEFCCKTIPHVDAANDFSVREIICCIEEIEQSHTVEQKTIAQWKKYLSEIDPMTCYTVKATAPTDKVKNWALFTGVSEFFRQDMGLCESTEFIDTQLESQFQWIDENGMYMDHIEEIHHPMVYDLVPRGLFCLLLNRGYKGKHRDKIDNILKKAGLLTLKMQSPNGEIPFGGRSNQFLHNEAWLCLIFEYEAKRYAKEGNTDLALRYKSASAKALASLRYWLSKKPIRHVKNHFPTETKYGCESYAYFDKYMITVASLLYSTYSVCDDSIPIISISDHDACFFSTSKHFHKFFMKCGGYGLEFEFNAHTHYESNGLGRIHYDGAPPAICLSAPCPSNPGYEVDIETPIPFSLCSMIKNGEIWYFAADNGTEYEVSETHEGTDSASATILCHFENGHTIKENYTICKTGVTVELSGDGEIGYTLPAFLFDGEKQTIVNHDEHTLTITYDGWICKYTTDGTIINLSKIAANRNGHYGAYAAQGIETLKIYIEINKKN